METEKSAKRLNSKNASKAIFLICLLAWPLIQFVVFYIAVNFNSILLAFEKYDTKLNLTFVGFENFGNVLREFGQSGGVLFTSIKNSIIVFVMTTVIGFPLNMFFSFYLFKKVKGHTLIRFLTMIPSIISGMIMGLVFIKIVDGPIPLMLEMMGKDKVYLLSDQKLILPTVIGYTLWTGFSTSLILYPNAMNAISTEVIESARLDGVNDIKELWYIVLPLIFPTITTFFVLGVAGMLSFSGPLFTFYEYNAPTPAWTGGYFFLRSTVGPGTTTAGYPRAAAAGIILTLISAPLTILTRWLFERFGPSEE